MKVAEVVVRILEKEGIEAAFGIPGAAINPVYEYLGTSEQIAHYIARHEEGAVHAADGYFRASGRLALAICTSGPGATNFVTGLYTAQIDSIPLIAITGQNVRAKLGKEAFQAWTLPRSAPGLQGDLVHHRARQVPSIMREAFQTAREGRPGPVLIDLPLDVQKADIPFDPRRTRRCPIRKPAPEPQPDRAGAGHAAGRREPGADHGRRRAAWPAPAERFVELAEYLSLPVITTYMATGGIPADHPLHVGHIGVQVGSPFGNQFFLGSDLVLGIGCRFNDRHTGQRGRLHPGAPVHPRQHRAIAHWPHRAHRAGHRRRRRAGAGRAAGRGQSAHRRARPPARVAAIPAAARRDGAQDRL